MRLLTLCVAAAAATVAVAGPAAAQHRLEGSRIEARINRGLRDGSLTFAEANRLRRQLYGVERAEYRYRRGGLTRWEARNIDRRYDLVSRHVWRQRHDRQRRHNYWR